jgi:hypothetical protein
MSLSQIFAVRKVQQLSAQEVIVRAMIANAGIRVRNDFFMVYWFWLVMQYSGTSSKPFYVILLIVMKNLFTTVIETAQIGLAFLPGSIPCAFGLINSAHFVDATGTTVLIACDEYEGHHYGQ